MSKKLADLFDLETPKKETEIKESELEAVNSDILLNQAQKISDSLPFVKDLEKDEEFDEIAHKSMQTFEDLMDLGMNSEGRYSGRIFEVAGQLMKVSLDSKIAKYNKKLKTVELQLKNRLLDIKDNKKESPINHDSSGILMDRNNLIKSIREEK